MIEQEYLRRSEQPFTAEVDGVTRTWHGDQEGMRNVNDVLLGIALGVGVPNPRPWKPLDSDEMTLVSHSGFAAIKLAHAARKDQLFIVQRALKDHIRSLAASGDAAAVSAFDPLSGWDD